MSSEMLTKCSVCSGQIAFKAGEILTRCPWCDRINDRPKSSETNTNLMKRANELRNEGEFHLANERYQKVLDENPAEHEARWGSLLCKYGVMYVEDNNENRKERLITCRRSLTSSFRDEEYYKLVLKQASPEVREEYERDAEYIDRVQGEIRRLRPQTEPYDVFLCYKETAPEGGKTEDSTLAHRLYNDLTRCDYRVFFAPESLKEKAGANYEAAIFLAIESSRVMVALGTRKEYFEGTWVRSEWRRYLERIDLGDEKTLIPLFRHASDLPDTFQKRMIQGYDMNQPYLEPLKTRLNNLLRKEDNRFKLVKIYLGRGDFQRADGLLDEMLISQPENAHIWLYKAMANVKISKEADFCSLEKPLTEIADFQTALEFATGYFKEQLKEYLEENTKSLQAAAERAAAEIHRIEEAQKAEEERKAEEKRKAEEERKAKEARKAEEERKAEEARKAEEKRKVEAERIENTEKKPAEVKVHYSFGNQKSLQSVQTEKANHYRTLALSGDAEAQYQYSLCLHYGRGVKSNETDAVEWMTKAAQAGYAKANEWLQRKQEAKQPAEVKFHYSFGNQKSLQSVQAEKANHYRELALSGDAEAQYQYALCLHYGRGVKPSEADAMEWMAKAAQAGYAKANEWLQKKQEAKQMAENARKAEEANYKYRLKNDGTVEITGFADKQKGTIIIPNRLNGCKVTSIGEKAFSFRDTLTSVTIPDGVTSIGAAVFWECFALTSVTIPSSLTSIGEQAFWKCISLTSMIIPPSVTNIGRWAFQGCSKLSSDERVRETWKRDGLCQYCGGEFNLFRKCQFCGRRKDY